MRLGDVLQKSQKGESDKMKKLFLILAVLSVCFLSGCNQENTKKKSELNINENMENTVIESGNEEKQELAGYTDEQLIEMTKKYRAEKGEYIPEYIEISPSNMDDNENASIHLYDILENHTATTDWYFISRITGIGTNILGEVIDLNHPEDMATSL